MNVLVLPSLLAADYGNLEAGARLAEESGGDALHLDIMDGHFVPNLSMGPDVVRMAKGVVGIPLSVHLMMTNPDRYLETFVKAGADSLLIHIEADCDVPAALRRIRELGVRSGITLNPATPADKVYPVLELVDEVLCMTVNPGYGGQAFIPEVLPKIRHVREQAKACGCGGVDIIVDGGIDPDTASECAGRGANSFVAGSSLYRSPDMRAAVAALRQSAVDALVP